MIKRLAGIVDNEELSAWKLGKFNTVDRCGSYYQMISKPSL